MKLQAFGLSQGIADAPNFDCMCVGPVVGTEPIRLEIDSLSSFVKRYGVLVAVADANPENAEATASRILLDELVQRFYSWENKGSDPSGVRRSVGAYLDEANQALLSRLADEERVAASATMSGFALLDGEVAVSFHIGDCRVLRESGGYLRPLTEDHLEIRTSYRGRIEQAILVEEGEPELTRFMGILGTGQPDIRMMNWAPGDTFFAGTRGWHGSHHGIARDAIKTALNAYHELSVFVERSINEAMRADGKVDATLAAVRVVD
jgi:serine/threonine protein phosphatase PrpC